MTLTASSEKFKGEDSESEKTTVSVVGCNRNGLLHACLLTEAEFKVTCVDSDRAVVERLSKGKVQFLKQEIEPILRKNLENGKLQVTCNLEDAVSQSNIVLITTPATVNEKGRIDYSSIEKTLKGLGSHLQRNTLVIVTSVLGVGVTESLLKETLESSSGFRVGVDCYLAYSPVPFPEKQTISSLRNCRRIVAAYDSTSLEKALKVIGAINKEGTIATLNLKAAEAAVLFDAIYRSVGFALANEFARLCEKTGVDYLTAQNLLSLSGEAFYQPMLDNFGEDFLLMLLEEAENRNVKLKISQASLNSGNEAVRHGVSLVQEALKTCGKTMRRAKIAILGVSQTRNIADNPKSVLKSFAKILERKGAKLSLYDPYLHRKTADADALEESLIKAVEGADCIVIFTGHDQFKRLNLGKIKLLVKMPAAIVDFEGIFDPYKVESEGFVYRGLGRGVWRK
ncbi:MAG: nucleotide sugar dehydrogenase [Candidatus Bathyarchaeia archaeon]